MTQPFLLKSTGLQHQPRKKIVICTVDRTVEDFGIPSHSPIVCRRGFSNTFIWIELDIYKSIPIAVNVYIRFINRYTPVLGSGIHCTSDRMGRIPILLLLYSGLLDVGTFIWSKDKFLLPGHEILHISHRLRVCHKPLSVLLRRCRRPRSYLLQQLMSL